MSKLHDVGFQMAQAGYPWKKVLTHGQPLISWMRLLPAHVS